MKILKKVIAGVAALAIAAGGISFGALSGKEVKALDVSDYTETTIGSMFSGTPVELSSSTWNSKWVQLSENDMAEGYDWASAIADDEVYLKVTYSANEAGAEVHDNGYQWGLGEWYTGDVKATAGNGDSPFYADSLMEADTYYSAYKKLSEVMAEIKITADDADQWGQIGFNMQANTGEGEPVFTLKSVEVVKLESKTYYETVISTTEYPATTDIILNDGEDFDSSSLTADAKLKIYLKTTEGDSIASGWGIGQVGQGDKWWDSTGKICDITSAGPNMEFTLTVPFSKVPKGACVGMKTWAEGSFITKISILDTKCPVSGVAFAEDSYTFTLSADGATPAQVTPVVTVSPEEATNKDYTLTSADTKVAKIVDGKIVPVGAGTTVITVKTKDGGFTDTCEIKVEAVKPTSVALAAVPTDVKGGDIVTLTATVTPDNATDKTVVWSSSDTEVATVDLNGKVTFANVSGTKTVTITAAAKADASVKATVTFTVEELVIENPVTGVTISDETLELTKGETADLTATVTPEDATLKTVTWESADETIATVDSDGKVTATGIGTTTITVKTVDGAKTASCEVTVNAPKATAVSVSVDGEEIDKLDMTVGDTVSLTATAEPDDAVQSFTFATSDDTVVTVDEEGVLTAVAAGTATITVTADDVSTEIEVTVTVKKDGSLDVDATGEFKPAIDMSNEAVVSAIKNVLSEEQLAAIEDGTAKVEITLDVTNIDATVSQEDKDLIAEAIESISGDYIVMNYLDIKFGANVDGEVITISETDGLITVSVALDKAANGTYKVVRIHDGKADVIDSELSADGTRLTFKTDKFSTYAIIFADVASGDSTPTALIALILLAAAAVIVTVSVSVKRTAKQR